jgi:hypothetical protein
MGKQSKPFRHISTGAILRHWSAARTDHRAEPEQQPAPRSLHWRVQLGSWADQPRAHRDQQRKRQHVRRQQKQERLRQHTLLQARLKHQQ